MYKNKTKEELLADVYRLEVSLNKSKELVNKQDELIDKIIGLIEEFKQKNWLNRLIVVVKLVSTILQLIKEYKDDTRRA